MIGQYPYDLRRSIGIAVVKLGVLSRSGLYYAYSAALQWQ
jgi:hypothetical protein